MKTGGFRKFATIFFFVFFLMSCFFFLSGFGYTNRVCVILYRVQRGGERCIVDRRTENQFY